MAAGHRRSVDCDPAEVERALRLLITTGSTFEIRALGSERGHSVTWSGFFVDPTVAASAIAPIAPRARGVYVTLNPVDPKLRARRSDRLEPAGKGETTGDQHIVRRTRLLIDIDAERPAGISSSATEHKAAIDVASEMSFELSSLGWPEPIHADSGNGGHLVYAVDLPAEDDGLVARVLATAASRWNCKVGDVALKVDTTVANPARISKVYGTVTRKGDNVDDRTHRLARIISAPTQLEVVPREALEAFAGPAVVETRSTQPRSSGSLPTLDVPAWLSRFGLEVRSASPNKDGGTIYELAVCPFNPDHDRGEAFVVQRSSGAIAAGCHHESCKWDWSQLREKYEPKRDRAPSSGFVPLDMSALPPQFTVIDGGGTVPTTPPTEQPKPTRKGKRWDWIVSEIYRRAHDPWISLRVDSVELASVRIGSYATMIGPEGSGKSSLILQMLSQHERDVGPAIYVTPELDADEAGARAIGQDRGASWRDALTGQVPRDLIVPHPRLTVLEREDATLKNLELEIDALREEYGVDCLILIGWDYLQASPADSEGERLRVAKLSSELRRFAKRKQVVIVGLSQSSRDGAKKLSSGELLGRDASRAGAESSQIERDGYVIFSIGDYQELPDGREGRSISLGKNRMGKGDVVFAAIYDGRTGRWHIDDPNGKPASTLRAEREGKNDSARIAAIELAMLKAAESATAPVTREHLREVSAANRDYGKRAIASLLNRGDLVEVARRLPRSRHHLIWTSDLAARHNVPLLTHQEGGE